MKRRRREKIRAGGRSRMKGTRRRNETAGRSSGDRTQEIGGTKKDSGEGRGWRTEGLLGLRLEGREKNRRWEGRRRKGMDTQIKQGTHTYNRMKRIGMGEEKINVRGVRKRRRQEV